MNLTRRFILRLQAWLWTAFALVCIGSALLVGVVSLVLPYADRFRPEIEQWLSQRLQREIRVERIEARWAAFGPRVTVRGLTVGSDDGGPRLEVEDATLGLDFFTWLRPWGQGMRSVQLSVDRIELERTTSGDWQLLGFETSQQPAGSGAEFLQWLARQRLFSFRAGQVVLHDRRLGLTAQVPGGDLTLYDAGRRVHLRGRFGDRASGVLEVHLEFTPQNEAAALYLAARDLDLSRWTRGMVEGLEVGGGSASFRIWGDLGDRSLFGDFEALDVDLAGTAGNAVRGRYRLDRIAGRLGGWARGDELGLAFEQVSLERGAQRWSTERLVVARSAERWHLIAEEAELEDLVGAVVLLPALPAGQRRQLRELHLAGHIHDLDLAFASGEDGLEVLGELHATGVGWRATGALPGVGEVAARLEFSGRRADGELSMDRGALALPRLFRAPLEKLSLDARLAADWSDGPPRLTVAQATIDHDGVRALARGELVFNGSRPFADLALSLETGRVEHAKRYWPVSVMPPDVVRWLDDALLDGEVSTGSLVLHGDLDDWPFRGREGRFLARAEVTGGTLDYLPRWPRVEDARVALEFDPFGLRTRLASARVQDVDVGPSTVDLPLFRDPMLTIDARGTGTGDALLDFLRAAPIFSRFADYMAPVSIAGEASFAFDLDVPLVKRLGRLRFEGHSLLEGATIRDRTWDTTFEETSGRIRFSGDGFDASGLTTRFRGQPATLSIRTGSYVEQPGLLAQGVLSAATSPGLLLSAEAWQRLAELPGPTVELLQQSGNWTARVDVFADGASPRLEFEGQIDPGEERLPAPLPGSGPLALGLSFPVKDPAADLKLTVGEVATLRAQRLQEDEPWSAALHFGPGSAPEPDGPGLAISGRMAALDLDGWLELVSGASAGMPGGQPGQTWVHAADLQIDALRLAQRSFHPLRVTLDRSPEHWTVRLLGEDMAGRLRLPSTLAENRLLLAEFEHLHWPAGEAAMETPQASFDPRILPPLDFFAADLRLGEADLGAVRFESFPTAEGLRVDSFSTQSPTIEVQARGDWLADHESAFSATISAPDLGKALELFGFTGIIDHGQLLARLEARWPGGPTQFDLARLDGELELSITNGDIVEVEPGAGRIFGLLSVQALPRRLLLDFSDLFSSGLGFDAISGRFRFVDGEARTDDFTIASSTAEILVQGQISLVDQEYDQLITVVPKVGGTLPVVGALAGGGVGAAAALVVQGLFSEQIDRITRFHYMVTGPWAKPAVELLGANDSRIEFDTYRAARDG